MGHFWTVAPPNKNFFDTNGVRCVEVLHHFSTGGKQTKIQAKKKKKKKNWKIYAICKFEKSTGKDNSHFTFSAPPDYTGYDNLETVLLIGTGYLSSKSGKLNLSLFLFQKIHNTFFWLLVLLPSLSNVIQVLFLVHKCNRHIVVYFNIIDLHLFNNYVVNIFLSVFHRLE
jgi:hypothetical protein